MKSPHEIFTAFPADFPLPFILDGATGTSLIRAGMPAGCPVHRFVRENPGVLVELQRGYYDAGSDAVLTPTFGGTEVSLARTGEHDATCTNSELAALTAGLGGRTGGDMSPTGMFISPWGDVSFDEVAAQYAAQARTLDGAGVSFFMLETNISLCEVRAAVTGIREVSRLPVFASLTVDKNGRTMSGDTPEASLLTLAALGVSAFGFNCSVGPEDMLLRLAPLAPLAASLGVALLAKPNAGLPHEQPDGTQSYDMTAEDFARTARDFINSGILVLGGCCGTDRCHIAELRKAADEAFAGWQFEFDPIDTSHMICTNRKVAVFDPDAAPVAADEDLFECEDDYAAVELKNSEDAEFIAENMHLIPCPIVLRGDRAAAESVIRVYNGKTVYLD